MKWGSKRSSTLPSTSKEASVGLLNMKATIFVGPRSGSMGSCGKFRAYSLSEFPKIIPFEFRIGTLRTPEI